MHHGHGDCQSDDIAHNADNEVWPAERRPLGRHFRWGPQSVSVQVKSETQGDDQSWHNDVSESEHGKVERGRREGVLLGCEQLDGCIDALGYGDHDWSCEDLGRMSVHAEPGLVARAGTRRTQKMS